MRTWASPNVISKSLTKLAYIMIKFVVNFKAGAAIYLKFIVSYIKGHISYMKNTMFN